MLFSIRELIDAIIMIVVVGFIFMDIFKRHDTSAKEAFKFACLVTAPAIIFHELAHKFAAMFFGLQATFNAAYTWLGIGVVLKFISPGLIFFVPAYVSIHGQATPGASGLIAFAGPALNLVLFVASWAILKKKKLKKKTFLILYVTKQINLFLFIFNMLPLPFFDGLKVYQGLFSLLKIM
ncbi:hypothetical protein COV18_01190 [Candidatus Woesearchaeota archaeon CG10_big_fil_rev_8_21_14_0_10_37_12]|nr:MAG: hypothetical protein COV18_01190 [Candidatus Woesearchaeota archaeon CG10_big_fil_rev_8_21_14_0_10_37_12]